MKQRTNVSIDKDLFLAAKANNLVLSALLEEGIKQRLKENDRQAWQEKNAKAINLYNERVDKEGVFSDGLRSF